MSAQLLHFPQIYTEEGTFRREYLWLLSDWPSYVWKVVDPGSDDNEGEQTLRFDGLLAPQINFEDHPEIIEDIKISLVLSVELGKVGTYTGSKVNSLSTMRQHVNNLKRAYRELFSMGCEQLDDVTPEEIIILKNRLAVPEYMSLGYPQRLKELFAVHDLESLPIKSHEDNKNPASVDLEWVRRKTGIVKDVMRNCSDSRKFIQDINEQLSNIYPSFSWDVGNDSYSDETGNRDDLVDKNTHKAHLTRMFRTLDGYYNQSELLNLFRYPLRHAPIAESARADAEELVTDTSINRGRTRNIPAEQFLTVMDRATRWVVDYSEPLFVLEKKANRAYQGYSAQYANQEAGKLIGGWIREQSSALSIKGKASPFPLSGYREGALKATTESKYTEEMMACVVDMLDQGVSRRQIAEEFGLTKNALQGVINRISDDRYNRNLPNTGVSLNEALYSFLPLSCALIILTFTAGRESAVYGLKAGCVQTVLGSRFIRMFVPKTLRRDDDFPTVVLVKKAVQVLERLSQSARQINGNDRLFQFDDLVGRGQPKGFRFDDVIERFLDFIEMPRDEDGKHFKFSEHQFRRFFAIMYFYRYEDGDFESLAYHLRHSDWSMTEIYLSEKEAGLIFKEVESERAASLAVRAAKGDRVAGAMADEFKNALDSKIRIVSENRSARAIRYVDENSLVMDFIPPGMCFGRTPGREDRAQCLLVDGDEKHVMTHRASESLCDGCSNLLTCEEVKANHEASGRSEAVLLCESPLHDAVIAKGGVS